MQQTSLLTYQQLREEGKLGQIQKLVFNAYNKYGNHTDLEIVKLLNFKDTNKVRPRRNELVRYGLLENKGKRKCNISGRKSIVWGIVIELLEEKLKGEKK